MRALAWLARYRYLQMLYVGTVDAVPYGAYDWLQPRKPSVLLHPQEPPRLQN